MDLYGRPATRRTSTPAVAFLNERPKSLSFTLGSKPGGSRGHGQDEDLRFNLPGHPSSNQQQQHNLQQQPPPLLHQRPTSSRFLNRPQSSSGVRRSDPALAASNEVKQRPRTARDGVRTLPTTQPYVKRTSCFGQESDVTEDPEVDGKNKGEELLESSPPLDEQYLEQLKADILHLHHVHRQLEKEANEGGKGERYSRVTTATPQAPNHVKNLLLHRDTKRDSSLDLGSLSTGSIQTQLQRYNYSSDPAQLTATKVGLEGLLADTLTSLMEFYLVHNNPGDSENNHSRGGSGAVDSSMDGIKMKLVRPTGQLSGDMPLLPFANGCGTSPVSIYAGGILSVLQQTEILKRTMLACTGEKKNLVKMIADKDTQLKQFTEQLCFFKDVLASRRPRFKQSKREHSPYKEREQSNAPEREENESFHDSGQSRSALAEEQLVRLASLEKDRVESILAIQRLERQKDELEQQLEKAKFESQAALERLESMKQLHEEAMGTSNNSYLEQIGALEKLTLDLQSSLASTVERYRSLEDSTSQEKAQLRRDKQELERLIRLKDGETGQRQAQATVKAEAQLQSAIIQLKLVTQQRNQAQQALHGLRVELNAAQVDNNQAQGTIRSLHHDLKVRNDDVERLSSKLAVANATVESKTALVQQSEARIETNTKEIERQQSVLDDQTRQVQALEAKLSRSVPVDDEELQSRQQREESAWHQRVSALEHALVAERQNTALFRDQQRRAIAMEQEKAVHAVEQAQAVAAELATANICLLERKRQREQEQHAFEQKLKEYADRVAELSSDKEALEREFNSLRPQHEQLQQAKEQAATTETILQEEVASLKGELKSLTEIRENLDRALAHALASPKVKSARHQASLSEVRAELQKAKQKITGLEEQLSRNGSIRTSEIDGKLAQLSARERRGAEDQRGLKKQRADATAERQQLQKEQAELDQRREVQLAAESKQKTDHKLLQQIIVLLAQRLQVLMALFDTVALPDATQASVGQTSATRSDSSDDVDIWREIQRQWGALRQELENVDWRLMDMRSQLEALLFEYVGQSLTPLESLDGEQRSSQSSGFHGPNPFSDAVAAGRDTVPVAEQLKVSRLLRRLSCPGESLESRARQVKAEEHETFALALAREMTAMKDSYERQLEELRAELRKTQQRRLVTSQRLRAELATERRRSQRAAAQLSERIVEMEAALVAQEKALAAAQTQQQAILDQHAAATSDDERQRALRELAELVGSDQRRRERERIAKLLTYCGASSVTVEHRDRTVEQEAVDEVLHRTLKLTCENELGAL
ncbi:uncharacterized protein KRP23_984 [Phytophthora ramorum]|uniref:uncharacterized protein n=1 Tax=Phytophthora ramorum TaxID=164328 RepID=UPI00309CACAD|nr:hypothetical protein KRP23_984 [Phytophthora ramorum]